VTPPPAPVITPASGSFTSSQSVTMSDGETGAAIRYTVGTGTSVPADPTATTGTLYATPFTATASQVVKAVAVDAAGNVSPVARRDYTITNTPQPPVSSTRLLVLTSSADTMVRQARPTSSFGNVTPLVSDNQELSTKNSSVQDYVRFTVPPFAAGEKIVGAQLAVMVTDPTTNGPAIWRTSPSWSETGLTWKSRPPRTSTAAVGNFGAMAAGARTVPVSGVTAAGQVSFQLYPESSDTLTYASREDGSTTTNHPTLALTISTP
jgi:hypothetical protein